MIKSFKHKGLKELFETGKTKKLGADVITRCLHRLDMLDAAGNATDMNVRGYKFHALKEIPVRYSVWVTGNYRITFEFDDGDAYKVDFEDYH